MSTGMLKRTAQTGRISASCFQDYLVGNYVPGYIVAFSTYARITVLRRNDDHKTAPFVARHEKYTVIFKTKILKLPFFFVFFYCIEKTIALYNVVAVNDNEM